MGTRFGALVIDTVILTIAVVVIDVILRAISVPTGLVDLVNLVIGFGYFGYFNGVRQQTIGKRALGLKVIDVQSGGAIGFGKGLLRYLVLAVTGAICTLGYWTPFFDSSGLRQGWHDKSVSSRVVTA
jgi:uncharacterized RDD family membrane protein YckC